MWCVCVCVCDTTNECLSHLPSVAFASALPMRVYPPQELKDPFLLTPEMNFWNLSELGELPCISMVFFFTQFWAGEFQFVSGVKRTTGVMHCKTLSLQTNAHKFRILLLREKTEQNTDRNDPAGQIFVQLKFTPQSDEQRFEQQRRILKRKTRAVFISPRHSKRQGISQPPHIL